MVWPKRMNKDCILKQIKEKKNFLGGASNAKICFLCNFGCVVTLAVTFAVM